MGVYYVERGVPGSNIATGGDAVWWGLVTITTVGYGDRFPVSPNGRIVGTLLLFAGIALFSVLTGFIANQFLAPRSTRGARIRAKLSGPEGQVAELRQLLDRAGGARGTHPAQDRRPRGGDPKYAAPSRLRVAMATTARLGTAARLRRLVERDMAGLAPGERRGWWLREALADDPGVPCPPPSATRPPTSSWSAAGSPACGRRGGSSSASRTSGSRSSSATSLRRRERAGTAGSSPGGGTRCRPSSRTTARRPVSPRRWRSTTHPRGSGSGPRATASTRGSRPGGRSS